VSCHAGFFWHLLLLLLLLLPAAPLFMPCRSYKAGTRPHASSPTSRRVYSRMCGSAHTCTRCRPLPPAQHCCGRDQAGCQCLAELFTTALSAPNGTAHLQPFNTAACCVVGESLGLLLASCVGGVGAARARWATIRPRCELLQPPHHPWPLEQPLLWAAAGYCWNIRCGTHPLMC
jgi:hypothetical protein